MQVYDSIVILGSRPRDPKTWRLPDHVYDSLDEAAELYHKGIARYITVSGKWTINFDVLGIRQPFTECDAMADRLLTRDIPTASILREAESKDTISNIYYIKRLVLRPNNLRTLLFIAAVPRLERIKFLCSRILGPEYVADVSGVPLEDPDMSRSETRNIAVQGEFLSPMRDGDDGWLDGKFYRGAYYNAVITRTKERASMEPFIDLADPEQSTLG